MGSAGPPRPPTWSRPTTQPIDIREPTPPPDTAPYQAFDAVSAAADRSDKTFKIWRLISIVAGIIVGVFTSGVAYQQFRGGNATKNDVDDQLQRELKPIREQLGRNTDAIDKIQSGVALIVKRAVAEANLYEAQQILRAYRKERQEDLDEWNAAKAEGKSRPKPQKRRDLIEAELAVERAETILRSIGPVNPP